MIVVLEVSSGVGDGEGDGDGDGDGEGVGEAASSVFFSNGREAKSATVSRNPIIATNCILFISTVTLDCHSAPGKYLFQSKKNDHVVDIKIFTSTKSQHCQIEIFWGHYVLVKR